jgi:hypothetical protein
MYPSLTVIGDNFVANSASRQSSRCCSVTLAEFKASVAQCENLIANAHRVDAAGVPILPSVDQGQITVAAFLNLFIAWESFLETSLHDLMVGGTPIGGQPTVRYVIPPNLAAAQKLLKGAMRYFDFANHENVRTIVNLYFQNGYPFEPHISAIVSELNDLKTMRNASAHISSTTQQALESLAGRIFGAPRPNITLYQLLTAVDPRSAAADTVFVEYRKKLEVAAELISNG